jgi:predicted dehydrogenase
MTGKDELRVAMVGYAFMGAAHSQAWRTVNRVFDLPVAAVMQVICGRHKERVQAAAEHLGWAEVETDWRRLVGRDDIDVIDICTPGDSHEEIAVAALEAGKHVLCEKPLANTIEEAERMALAAQRAAARGVRSMVGFNYRRVPAVALARQLVQEGRLGQIRHVRAQYLQDWIIDPEFPLVWRLQRDKAGSGALGDLGAHIIDLAQHVARDEVTGVSALTVTFVKQRPLAAASAGLSGAGASEMGEVTVGDAALFLARFAGGAVASFEATRFATGHKNALRLEIEGSRGSLHPYMSAWWPPGHIIGYEHTFTHEIRDLIEGFATGTNPSPSFADGLQVQRVLAAVEASAGEAGCWTSIRR